MPDYAAPVLSEGLRLHDYVPFAAALVRLSIGAGHRDLFAELDRIIEPHLLFGMKPDCLASAVACREQLDEIVAKQRGLADPLSAERAPLQIPWRVIVLREREPLNLVVIN